MDALFGVFQSKMILFFLYHLGDNGQLFEWQVINWTVVFKIKKWEIILSCISPRTPWLYKFKFNLYWLKLSLNLVIVVPIYWHPHTAQDIKYITSLLLQSNRQFILYVFFVTKLLNSFPGTRILQISHLLELQLKLPVKKSDSGLNFDLTKQSFKDLALWNATHGGDVNTFESLLDFKR